MKTKPLPDVTCPTCWLLYHVRGSVVVVLDADGQELWRRCVCGADVPMVAQVQAELF